MSASVGIVWSVPNGRSGLYLVTDRTPLAEAEPYGDCLTHPWGHYEIWETWRRFGPAGLKHCGLPVAIAWHEYVELPHGRVVFHACGFRFTLYADLKLRRASVLASILRVFDLNSAWCDVRSDPHYRTAGARSAIGLLMRYLATRYEPALATNPATPPSSSRRRQSASAATSLACLLGHATTAVEA